MSGPELDTAALRARWNVPYAAGAEELRDLNDLCDALDEAEFELSVCQGRLEGARQLSDQARAAVALTATHLASARAELARLADCEECHRCASTGHTHPPETTLEVERLMAELARQRKREAALVADRDNAWRRQAALCDALDAARAEVERVTADEDPARRSPAPAPPPHHRGAEGPMSDYDPTDDELRAIADNAQHAPVRRDLARLVLREREAAATVAAVLRSQTDNVIATEKLADRLAAQRDQERTRAEQAEAELVGECPADPDQLIKDVSAAAWDDCAAWVQRMAENTDAEYAVRRVAQFNPYRAALAGPPAADDVWTEPEIVRVHINAAIRHAAILALAEGTGERAQAMADGAATSVRLLADAIRYTPTAPEWPPAPTAADIANDFNKRHFDVDPPFPAPAGGDEGPCAGCGHQPGEHPIHCDGWLDTAPAEFPGGLAVQAGAKPAINSVCGARGICISPTPSGAVPVCGKPAGHVEAGDRWHTPDTDDWGSDMRWAVRG